MAHITSKYNEEYKKYIYIKVANKPVSAIIDQFLCYRQCLKYLNMLYLIN